MATTDLVVLGDSVMWGQGLLDQHKSSTLVAQGLQARIPGIQPVVMAHSGAVIGVSASCAATTFPGEIPESCPSILQQVDAYPGDGASVPVVMLNGGINDIDIRTILNPFTDPNDLSSDIHQYCHDDMAKLLTKVKLRFSRPDVKIVVSSYFPILTSVSHPSLIPAMVEFLGAPLPSLMTMSTSANLVGLNNPITGKIFSLCVQFWHESTAALAKCVADVNLGPGPRCFFANVPFTENNAVFAPQAWLFGVGPFPDFGPLDEVAATRHPQCDVVFHNDFVAREQCYRASAGHPNVTGAQQYAQAILKAIQ